MSGKFSPLLRAGWEVIPLSRDGDKTPLVSGYHGRGHKVADVDTVKGWAKRYPDANPAIVLPPGVIGFDVDSGSHGDGVDGLRALAEFERRFGPLPETGHIYHGTDERGDPSAYGTYLYRVPESMLDVYTSGGIVGNLTKVTGIGGVDVITPWLRYNVAPGAVHSSGEVYDFTPSPPVSPWLPNPADLPELSRKHVEALVKRRRTSAPAPREEPATPAAVGKPIEAATGPETGKELLAQVRALVALPEGETMLIKGEQRGWQKNDGFFVLACSIARIAKDREKAKRLFLRAAEGYDDAERRWDDAVASVEDEEPEGEPPYPVGVNTEPYRFSEELLNRHFRNADGVLTLRLREDDETFWLWDDDRARYVAVSDQTVQAIVAKALAGAHETVVGDQGAVVRPVKVKSSNYIEVVKNLKALTLTSKWGGGALLPSKGGVPFLNGWLDVSNGSLLPVGPERDVRWNVPLTYDPNDGGTVEEWTKFLKSIGWGPGTEEYRLLRQWFGYVLSGSKAQQKAMILIGPTRSGKGIILKIAGAMLGDGAVGTQMDALADKNGLENVIGRGLVTVGDARFSFKTDKGLAGRLLSLIGDDEMTVNAKYRNLVSARLDARLMLATNEPPTFTEASDALARRFVMLQTTESFLGREDFGLEKRLMTELPGIVKWALEGLDDLNEVGKFVQTSTGHELQEQLVRDSAPVRVFVEEECEFGPYKMQKQTLYDEYVYWARQNGINFILSNAQFYRDLGTAFPGKTKTTKPRIGGKQVPFVSGIRLVK